MESTWEYDRIGDHRQRESRSPNNVSKRKAVAPEQFYNPDRLKDNMAHMQPPVPYADFTLTFQTSEPLPPMLSPSLGPIPDLPTSNLLSSAESNSFFGFLDKFEWEFDPVLPNGMPVYSPNSSGSDIATLPIASSSTSLDSSTATWPARSSSNYPSDPPRRPTRSKASSDHPPRRSVSSSSSPPPRAEPPHHNHTTRTKPLLSQPQKRLNHIMSEQKRRNAIRDGYATLTNMLAPAGAPVGSGIPTRGRPKGSGMRGKKGAGGAKGKSGVLFRAVEYCRWLEEGCEALRHEVERIEIAAGLAGEVR